MSQKTTLKYFLNEYISSDDLTIEQAAEMINERGGQWRDFVGGFATDHLNWIFYRGMHIMYSPDVSVQYPRSKRKPLSTDNRSHQFADDYFYEKFGKRFRSNAIFASRSADLAKYYGEVYVIFPLDETHFCWSEKSEDFTYSVDMFKKSLGITIDGPAGRMTEEKFKEFMDDLEFHFDDDSLKTTYVKQRKFKSYEVMISCDEYIAVEKESLPKLLELLK